MLRLQKSAPSARRIGVLGTVSARTAGTGWRSPNGEHGLGDHRYCPEMGDPGWCEFADTLAADVLAVGLRHATEARPLALVILSPDGRPSCSRVAPTATTGRPSLPARSGWRRVRSQGPRMACLRSVRALH